MLKTTLACLALVCASAAPALAADLFVGPGQTYAEITPAIAAAQPGDRIFVAPGAYEPFTLTKPVEVRGSGVGVTRIGTFSSSLFTVVSGIPAGTTATLSDLSFDPAWFLTMTLSPHVTVDNCSGTVVLRNIHTNQTPTAQHGGAGVYVKDSVRVLIQGSTIEGYENLGFGAYGQPGLVAFNSALDVADSDLIAANAGESFGFPGPAGADLRDCVVRFARVRATGGNATSDPFLPGQGGPGVLLDNTTLVVAGGPGNQMTGAYSPDKGGAGLQLLNGSVATLAPDVALQGGVNGDGSGSAPGLGVEVGSTATTLTYALPALVLDVQQAPLGSTIILTHSGEPGGLVVPALSGQLGPPLALPGFGGLVHLDTTSLLFWPTVVLDGAGLGTTSLSVPSAPAFAGAHAWIQAGQIAAGSIELSNPARVEVLL